MAGHRYSPEQLRELQQMVKAGGSVAKAAARAAVRPDEPTAAKRGTRRSFAAVPLRTQPYFSAGGGSTHIA